MTEFEKWAKIEIALALNANDEDHEYMADCYKSALKAFKALLNDGHSGCSISITKNILNRLIERKPLSPILGACNEWGPVSPKRNKDGWKRLGLKEHLCPSCAMIWKRFKNQTKGENDDC